MYADAYLFSAFFFFAVLLKKTQRFIQFIKKFGGFALIIFDAGFVGINALPFEFPKVNIGTFHRIFTDNYC